MKTRVRLPAGETFHQFFFALLSVHSIVSHIKHQRASLMRRALRVSLVLPLLFPFARLASFFRVRRACIVDCHSAFCPRATELLCVSVAPPRARGVSIFVSPCAMFPSSIMVARRAISPGRTFLGEQREIRSGATLLAFCCGRAFCAASLWSFVGLSAPVPQLSGKLSQD